MLLKLHVLTLSVGVPLAFLLIPSFGIVGLILTILFAQFPSLFSGIIWIWKRYQIRADFVSSAKILLASAIAGIATYVFVNAFAAEAWMSLLAGAIFFMAFYLLSAPLIGAINQTDINNLRFMFSGLGIISKLLDLLLKLVEKPIRISEKISKATVEEEKSNLFVR